MKSIAWTELMTLGLRHLGIPPATFWDLTPAELAFIAGADAPAMSRTELRALMERFPDKEDINDGPKRQP
ncbi:MAG: phage tail assembly chaperone [Pseudomonadota bacterium]